MGQNHTPLTKEILTEALQGLATKETLTEALLGLEERLDAKWELKLDSKLQRFATKDDLRDFATKDDLRDFATKDDLKDFATKEDLERFPTKNDLRNVQVAVARLEGDVREIKHVLKTEYATKREMEPYRLLAERAIKEMDEHRELRSTRGALLGDVVEKVENHERRLRGIEDRN